MIRSLRVLPALMLLACAAPASDESVDAEVKSAPSEDARAYGPLARSLKTARDCTEAGGVWGRGGLSPEPFCNMRYPDAGAACRDESECGGRCIAAERSGGGGKKPVGRCQTFTTEFGCYALIEDGQVGPTLCVD